MIHDARTAGLLSAGSSLDRLNVVIEAATTTFTETFDDCEQARPTGYLEKTALSTDQAWQQTVSGNRGPSDGGVDEEEGTSTSTPTATVAPARQNHKLWRQDNFAEIRCMAVDDKD